MVPKFLFYYIIERLEQEKPVKNYLVKPEDIARKSLPEFLKRRSELRFIMQYHLLHLFSCLDFEICCRIDKSRTYSVSDSNGCRHGGGKSAIIPENLWWDRRHGRGSIKFIRNSYTCTPSTFSILPEGSSLGAILPQKTEKLI